MQTDLPQPAAQAELKTAKSLLSIGEAAKFLSVSIDTIRRWDASGKIRIVRTPGGTRLVPAQEVERIKKLGEQSKKFISVGKAAKLLSISIDTLRRWDKLGRIRTVRTPGGTRLVSASEIERLKQEWKPTPPAEPAVVKIVSSPIKELAPVPPIPKKLYQKIIHHIRFTRPVWYQRWQAHPAAMPTHLAILGIAVIALSSLVFYQWFLVPYAKNSQANLDKLGKTLAAVSPPRVLSFQGRLTDNNNVPIASSTNIRFRIYTSTSGDTGDPCANTCKWESKTWTVSPDQNGIFSVVLGDTGASDTAIPSTLFSENDALYLGVKAGSDAEMTPRQRIASVSYALNSDSLDGIDSLSFLRSDTSDTFSGGTLTLTFAGTQNLATTSDLAGTVNVISLIGTPSASAGTAQGLFIQQADSANSNGLDAAIVINNADTNLAITDAILITNTGGGAYGDYIDAPNFAVTNAGAVTAVGVNSGAGLLQGALGLTITGAAVSLNASSNFDTNINTGTSTGTITIGNSASTNIKLGKFVTANGVIYVSATDGTVAETAASASTQCLQTAGAGTAPVWGACGGSVAFSAVTVGTNANALVIGTGGSLTTSGTGTITASDVVCTDCIALTSETSGNYVASVSTSALTGLTGGSSGSEGATLSLALDETTALSGDPALSANTEVFGVNGLVFEGSTDDTNETFIAVTDPTADHVFTFPNVASGNVCISGVACVSTSGTAGTFTANYVANAATSTITGLTGGSAGSNAASLSLGLDETTALSGDPALSANTEVFGVNGLVFEGSSADTLETFIAVTNPATADRTFTFPDVASGDVCISGVACVSTSGTASSVSFANVTAATNTNALVIGTGGSLGTSGSGTITATDLSCTDCVALKTETSGNYVEYANTSALTGLTGGSSGSEGADLSLALDESQALSGDVGLAANNEVFGVNGIVFEGATANTYETFIAVTDPTADRTITFPDASITVNAAADISGTTLASNVVASSLTSVGTIGTGTWHGTNIGVGYGGTNLSTVAAGSILAANTLDTLSAITSTSGTKVLTNTAGTITWETSAAGSPALSAITAATGTHTIANGTYGQIWNWALTGSQTAFTFGETTAASSTGNTLLQVTTLATSTASPLTITSGGTADIVFNLASTGDFLIQDNGTAFATFADDGSITLGKSGAASTINIGNSAYAHTITIGNAAATNVSITDDNWSITTGGVASFITGSVIGSQTFTTNNIADSGALTIKSATGSNALTLDSGTTGDVNLGTGANAKSITFGNTGVATTFTFNSGATTQTALSLATASLTTGEALDITATSAPTGGGTQSIIDFNFTNSSSSTANTLRGLDISLVDAVALGNTNYGLYNSVSNTGANSTGTTKNIYGSYIGATGSGSLLTGAANVYGAYITATGTVAGTGTVNTYGSYIALSGLSTTGTSTGYGLYIEDVTGADTNYPIYQAGTTGYNIFKAHSVFGGSGAGSANEVLSLAESLGSDTASDYGVKTNVTITGDANPVDYGHYLETTYSGTPPGTLLPWGSAKVYGAYIKYTSASQNGYGNYAPAYQYGLAVVAASTAATAAPNVMTGIDVSSSFGVAPGNTTYGIHIGNMGVSGTPASYGLYIDNQTGSTTNYAIYQAGTTGTNVFNASSTFNNQVIIGAQADATASVFTTTNSAAGTFVAVNDTNIDGAFSSAVYNGKVYVGVKETDLAAVYRFDGGTTWVRVTDSTRGKIITGDTANIDAIVLTVWNGKLYAGTQTGSGTNTGAVYSYDGSTWALVNSARGTFAATETGVDGVSDVTVWNGKLYVSTQETDAGCFYRYDGGTTFTRINFAVGKGVTGDTASIDSGKLISYAGRLWWGVATSVTTTTGLARLYMWDGTNAGAVTTTNLVQINTTGGTFITDTGLEDVSSLAVYNGQLFIGTADLTANLANIYVYTGGVIGVAGSANFIKTTATAGRIDTTDATDVDSVPVMRVYNGRLYAGSATGTTTGAIFEYDGVSAWTKVNTTRGTFGSETTVQEVDSLVELNGTLYVGTYTSNIGSVYTWTKTLGNSYSLRFDSGSSNYGSIGYVGAQQANDNANHAGTFLFTSPISSTSGSFDYAEDYPTLDSSLEPGEIVSIDPSFSEHVKRASPEDKETSYMGVVSESPGFTLSQKAELVGEGHYVPVALAGRVSTKVSSENGPIESGDPLTISSAPGVARKATQSGPIIGKALEAYDNTDPTAVGKIMVFVSVGWYVEPVTSDTQSATSSASISTDSLSIGDYKLAIDADNNLAVTIPAGSKLIFKDPAGNALAWVSSLGDAFFEKVTALVGDFNKLVFGELAVKKESQTAGTASIDQDKTEVVIQSDKVQDDSLIYITPTTDTDGLILFVREKKAGESFTVALSVSDKLKELLGEPKEATPSATLKIEFNWVIINQK